MEVDDWLWPPPEGNGPKGEEGEELNLPLGMCFTTYIISTTHCAES